MKDNRCDQIEQMPRPRFIKSHLPLFLLPDKLWTVKPKIIYVARNPMDLSLSYYHHHFHMEKCEISVDDFIEAFTSDQMLYSPYNEHVLEFWKMRKEENLLYLFYEDMKRDFDGAIKKLASFLGKTFTQEQIDIAVNYLTFDKMKANPKINMSGMTTKNFAFMRKGKVGSYKEELTEEQIKKLEDYSKHPEFQKFGFEYKF